MEYAVYKTTATTRKKWADRVIVRVRLDAAPFSLIICIMWFFAPLCRGRNKDARRRIHDARRTRILHVLLLFDFTRESRPGPRPWRRARVDTISVCAYIGRASPLRQPGRIVGTRRDARRRRRLVGRAAEPDGRARRAPSAHVCILITVISGSVPGRRPECGVCVCVCLCKRAHSSARIWVGLTLPKNPEHGGARGES